MMGTLVQPQLYTFSYREALFPPQIMPTPPIGVRKVKIAKSRKYAMTKLTTFLECNRQNLSVEKVEKNHH